MPYAYTKDVLLNSLREKISFLNIFILKNNKLPQNRNIDIYVNAAPQDNTFTLEELAFYNGKNGNPAYVAVNGIVYDVTNNAAWAAATHFGLTAGRDLTSAFSSCHTGNASILNSLTAIGTLINE